MNPNEILRQLRNIVRKGSILAIEGALCRVAVGGGDDDAGDGLETNWIPWFALAAGHVADWRAPSRGEQVMLMCPNGDPAQGVALCGFYSDTFAAPSNDLNVTARRYADGATTSYNHATHALAVDLPAGATINVTSPGSVTVKTSAATVHADTVELDADVTVVRTLTVKGRLAFESGMTGKGDANGTGPVMAIDGRADFTGEVTSAGVSLPRHTHREQGDGNLVSPPQDIGGAS